MTETKPEKEADGFRRAVRTLAMYRAAAWLYHHGPAEINSPVSDELFDFWERTLGMPKELGHTIQLTEDEQRRAIEWAVKASFEPVEKTEG